MSLNQKAHKDLKAADNHVCLELDPSPVEPQMRPKLQLTPWMKFCEIPEQRTQISIILAPDPQNLWQNKCVLSV